MALKIAFARRRSFHQLLQSVSFTFYIRFTSDAEYVLKEFLASLAILYNEICMDDEKACSRDWTTRKVIHMHSWGCSRDCICVERRV